MLDAAREAGKLLTIGYQNRFREDSLFMKDLCDRGELGDIYFGKAFATRRRGVPTWGVFMDKEKQGGGPLIDLATHALDLTLWMMNNYEPDVVLGATFDKIAKIGSPANIMGPWDPAAYEVEDSAFGLVKFKNGATVMIESSWALNMIVSNEAMTMLCGTKAGADMFPPTGPIVRTADFQSASSLHVRVNGESAGKLYRAPASFTSRTTRWAPHLSATVVGPRILTAASGNAERPSSWSSQSRPTQSRGSWTRSINPRTAVIYQSANSGQAVTVA